MKRSLSTGMWFGVPPWILSIPGFEVVAAPDEFLCCRQGEKEFIVQILPRHFRLFPYAFSPNFNGKVAHFDRAIWIPMDDLPCSDNDPFKEFVDGLLKDLKKPRKWRVIAYDEVFATKEGGQ